MTIAETFIDHVPAWSRQASSAPPAPPALPLLGHMRAIKPDPLNYFVNVAREFGDVVPLRVGPKRLFMVNHPDLIHQVLASRQQSFRKGKFYQKSKPAFGENMVISEGAKWLTLRRTALPAMQGRPLVAQSEHFVDGADALVERWRSLAETGQVFDMNKEMTRLSLQMVLRTLCRVEHEVDGDRAFSCLNAIFREIERRMWTLTPIGEYLPTRRNIAFKRNVKILHEMIEGLIEKRRSVAEGRDDLLSLLLKATDDPENEVYTETQLRDECLAFIVGARDTAAGALTWTFYLLSKHAEVERRLRDEVDRVLGGRRPGYGDLDKLPYLQMVFLEAMRLYPPIWTISRDALVDEDIAGVTVRKGESVMLCIYALHHNPKYWDNPEAFDPERFSPEREGERHPRAHLPFGSGGRICIGRKMALIEGPLLIARVMQHYRMKLVPGQVIEPEPMITLRPRYGIHMVLEPRDRPVRTFASSGGEVAAGGCPHHAGQAHA